MPDPFEALHTPVHPIDPDPAFAERLRALVERALALPEGVTVSNLTLERESVTHVEPTLGAAVPYLAVRDGQRAIDWYVEVLGARLLDAPIIMADGRIGHANLELNGGMLYLAEEFPEIGVVAPEPDRSAVSLRLHVPDLDATVEAAVNAGGVLVREIDEAHGSRNATIIDPFGHRWMLQTPLPMVARLPVDWRAGDIAYVSLWVPDVERAATFFSAVLGWTYGPGSSGQSRQVAGTTVPHGLYGAQERSTLFCCYAVDDVDAAVHRVRDAGGQADEPVAEPYGRVANCVDDQRTPFALIELAPSDGARTGVRPVNGVRPGDLAYVTLEVTDTSRARAFYGTVLGWQFSPGRVEDGWGVGDIMPMTGLGGGRAQATGVPMYRVDDIEAAVSRVRAAGGTATEAESQPYGITAECVDDQGTRFYLGQV